MKKDDVELIVEGATGEEAVPVQAAAANAATATDGPAAATDGPAAGGDDNAAASAGRRTDSALQQIKEQVSEDDEGISGRAVTLRQIVGGDYLLTLVRHYLWFIILVVLLTCIYVAIRYQCQQDVIEISRLEKELVDAKYRAMSSSSNLTEMCRQSNVLKSLSENEDNELTFAEQPPYIIEVGE